MAFGNKTFPVERRFHSVNGLCCC